MDGQRGRDDVDHHAQQRLAGEQPAAPGVEQQERGRQVEGGRQPAEHRIARGVLQLPYRTEEGERQQPGLEDPVQREEIQLAA